MEPFLSNVDETNHALGPGYDQALRDLAQILAHRIRGLIASIEGFTDLLTDTLVTREQRELALRVFEGASRIERILADLQRYGKQLKPVLLPLQLNDVTDELLIPIAEADQDRLTLVAPENEDRLILADPFLLRQALLELVQNALDATRHGGAVRIEISVREEEDVFQFDVKNDGSIKLENPEQVFLPFFTTKAHNLGVGLPMAVRIVKLHEGCLNLTANSERDGTCFSMQIPIAEDEMNGKTDI